VSFFHNTLFRSEQFPVSLAQVDEFIYSSQEMLKQGRSRDGRKKKIVGAVDLLLTKPAFGNNDIFMD